MSRPAFIWGDKLDFPILKSLDDDVIDVVYGMFNFDTSVIRDYMDVSVPNFQNMSLASYCTINVDDANAQKYCQIAENLPDLEDIMALMYLASSPTDISSSQLMKKMK